ncbi:UPF0179 family protein [Thermoproteus tenax]|uniref:UPF0179 protein TTX_1663 n=1 Tax=Thermoproteus tenax (strain ATCC 35583 / DSM 2078 / JCM 9277 / NBRC 100435 / Kra 1) TaxID=768679 RepID=G4RL39_THETK|nr:UPF0179 family protein [Thermoproteus tenax]CCC82284.1 conserved hypothetical protein [Thermoproteus tenax Kra 1]
MGRVVITMVSKEQAELGHRFKVLKIPEECTSCKLFSVCMGRLRVGRTYRVVEVRPSLGQRCKITGDEMVPVAAEEMPIRLLLPRNKALEGVVVTYEEECKGCENCPDREVLRPGEKVLVLKILGKSQCKNREFYLVEASPL